MSPTAAQATSFTVVTPDQDVVFQRVCDFLAPFNRSGVVLTRDTEISKDMEVDSVAVFDLIMEVEDEYEVAFPMETISDMKTIGDLVKTIETLKA